MPRDKEKARLRSLKYARKFLKNPLFTGKLLDSEGRPTIEALEHRFRYCSETGLLFWKLINKNRKHPTACHSIGKNGYKFINFQYKKYLVHRIVYFMQNKEWPKLIDHINGNRLDNRISNLRKSDSRLNSLNNEANRKGNEFGTSFNKHTNRWTVYIRLNNKSKYLGSYRTKSEGHLRYKKELEKIYANKT